MTAMRRDADGTRRRARALRALASCSFACVALAFGCSSQEPAAAPAYAGDAAAARSAAGAGAPLPRIVSLNPSLTAIVVELGAADALVGVDDFSARSQPAVAGLPRVGGLFSPSLEGVVALEPDTVVFVPGARQRAFQERIEELGVATRAFPNIRFDEVLANIRDLGAIVGRVAPAEQRIAAIERARERARNGAEGRTRPRTLLVLQRDPLYVVGGANFIDEMLQAAGGDNVAGRFDEAYPRVSLEWVLERAPELVVDLATPAAGPSAEAEAGAFWSRWPTLPAVAAGSVVVLDPAEITLPGPRLDRSLALLSDVVRSASRDAASVGSRR